MHSAKSHSIKEVEEAGLCAKFFFQHEDAFILQHIVEKIQFYHSSTHDDRAQIWFHPWVPPAEVPDDEYPFILCTGRVLEHWHSGSMTRRIPELSRAMPSAYIEIHPADADAANIRNGDKVKVESRRGVLEIQAWINGRGQPPRGSVFIPFFDESLLVNDLTLDAVDPFSKQPDYKKSAVRISKVAPDA